MERVDHGAVAAARRIVVQLQDHASVGPHGRGLCERPGRQVGVGLCRLEQIDNRRRTHNRRIVQNAVTSRNKKVQPLLAPFPVRHTACQKPVEFLRMIPHFQMHQFVHNDVLDAVERGLHKFRVE